MPGSTPGLDPEQVKKASAALLKFVGAQKEESKELLQDDEVFHLVRCSFSGTLVPLHSNKLRADSPVFAAHLTQVYPPEQKEQQACSPVSLPINRMRVYSPFHF